MALKNLAEFRNNLSREARFNVLKAQSRDAFNSLEWVRQEPQPARNAPPATSL